ncbi:hypothetical protein ABFX02_04G223100 [Erythranthe guttata]
MAPVEEVMINVDDEVDDGDYQHNPEVIIPVEDGVDDGNAEDEIIPVEDGVDDGNAEDEIIPVEDGVDDGNAEDEIIPVEDGEYQHNPVEDEADDNGEIQNPEEDEVRAPPRRDIMIKIAFAMVVIAIEWILRSCLHKEISEVFCSFPILCISTRQQLKIPNNARMSLSKLLLTKFS